MWRLRACVRIHSLHRVCIGGQDDQVLSLEVAELEKALFQANMGVVVYQRLHPVLHLIGYYRNPCIRSYFSG